MAAPPPQTSDSHSESIERAANLAASRVKQLLIEMLSQGETGEVAIVVSYGFLEPQKRPIEKAKAIKVARGQLDRVERISQP